MEIVMPLNLTHEEMALIDMHSVLNVLNVINYEILKIGDILGENDLVLDQMEEVAKAGEILRDESKANRLLKELDPLIARIEAALDAAIARHPEANLSAIEPLRENLRNIYNIIHIRAREIRTRQEAPDAWVEHSLDHLRSNFVEFLAAVEKNAGGRYRIVPNIAAQGEGDYLIQFQISSENDMTLRMPIIFQDVMRDLLANARKYTRPGGSITGGLHAGKDSLRFIVQDTGMGIPESELEQVVLFGRRGTNAISRPTRGGGFGLTKAYYVTKRYHGRMWIESSTGLDGGGSWTSIEIHIPYPEAS